MGRVAGGGHGGHAAEIVVFVGDGIGRAPGGQYAAFGVVRGLCDLPEGVGDRALPPGGVVGEGGDVPGGVGNRSDLSEGVIHKGLPDAARAAVGSSGRGKLPAEIVDLPPRHIPRRCHGKGYHGPNADSSNPWKTGNHRYRSRLLYHLPCRFCHYVRTSLTPLYPIVICYDATPLPLATRRYDATPLPARFPVSRYPYTPLLTSRGSALYRYLSSSILLGATGLGELPAYSFHHESHPHLKYISIGNTPCATYPDHANILLSKSLAHLLFHNNRRPLHSSHRNRQQYLPAIQSKHSVHVPMAIISNSGYGVFADTHRYHSIFSHLHRCGPHKF